MTYFLLSLALLCVGCSLRCKEIVAFDRVTSKVDKVLAKEEGLLIFGTGIRGPGYFKGISLSYIFPMEVSLEESRRIFLKAIETTIKIVNEDTNFVQYMQPPPLTSDQLAFGILFSPDDTKVYMDMIKERNNISYFLMIPDSASKKIGSETLEEAIRIVEAEGMQLDYLKKYMDKSSLLESCFPESQQAGKQGI